MNTTHRPHYDPSCPHCIRDGEIFSRRSTYLILLEIELRELLKLHGIELTHEDLQDKLAKLRKEGSPDAGNTWTYAAQIKGDRR